MVQVTTLLGVTADLRAYDVTADFEQSQKEFDEAQETLAANPAKARALFRSSANRLEGIVRSGINNGQLEFNLANCYLQAGDIGQAILHYRRAERFIPSDAMLANNLSVARERCLTAIKPTRGSAFVKNVFFWHFQTSTGARLKTALLAYVGFWILLVVRGFVRRRGVVIAAAIVGVVACVSAGSVAASNWADRNAPEGVVTSMDLTVFKGPGTGYQRQFEQPLQPGVEFTLRDQTRTGWWRIQLVDGKTGWIQESQGMLIPPADLWDRL